MYRRTSRQSPLFPAASRLPSAARARLEASWANAFAEKVLPILLKVEDQLRGLYHPEIGRPNWSIARMVGILILAEAWDHVDEVALDCLQFDVRWQHALALPPEDAYLSRRSLVNFRARLAGADDDALVRAVFGAIREAALTDLRLGHTQVRLDSTRIISNVQVKGRTHLFSSTLRHFLGTLARAAPRKVELVPAPIRVWFERAADAAEDESAAPKGRLERLASWLLQVKRAFAGDVEVRSWESYALICRLLDEQCVVDDAASTPVGPGGAGAPATSMVPSTKEAGDTSAGTPVGENTSSSDRGAAIAASREPAPAESPGPSSSPPSTVETVEPALVVRPKARDVGTALNTPFDPDMEFGHKGPGYHVQIAETCNNGATTEIIVDYTVHGASRPDSGQMQASLRRLEAAALRPDVVYTDQGYTQGSAFEDAEARGVLLHGPARTERLSLDSIGRDAFTTDPDTGRFTHCPAGHPIKAYTFRRKRVGQEHTPFALITREHCVGCPMLERCVATLPPATKTGVGGDAYVQDLPRLRARDRALARQSDPDWWSRYSIRSGIEATNSELKRKHGLGRLRVRRLARVQIAVGMKITSCNVKRWLSTPTGPGRPPDWRSKPRSLSPRKASAETTPG